jgi:hypothetical protein
LAAAVASPKLLLALKPPVPPTSRFPWGDSPTPIFWLSRDHARIGDRYHPPPVAPKLMLRNANNLLMFDRRLQGEELERVRRSLGYPKVSLFGGTSS